MSRTYFGGAFALLVLLAAPPGCQGPVIDSGHAALTGATTLPGAIFTTTVDGSRVNKNIYEFKADVYLDGGPGLHAPAFAAGLPAGDYYFQVTDPSGKDLLSSDHITCRRFHVNEFGVIDAVYSGVNYVRWHGSWAAETCEHATGIDQDHAAEGAITVQLLPYDDTPNKGGVYKVWVTPVDQYIGDPGQVPDRPGDSVNGEGWEPGNFHGFVPAESKTDNYKVAKRGKPYLPPILAVEKFHDRNLDAVQGPDEEDVTGWLVVVTDPVGSGNVLFTPASVTASEGLWAVVEDLRAGTTQTASYLDGALISSYDAADPLVEVYVAGDSGEYHVVRYGNAGLGQVTACKGYDPDGDGVIVGDAAVAGWRFSLSGVTVRGDPVGPLEATAGEDGCAAFPELLPGSYAVTELFPSTPGWEPTGPTSQAVVIESSLEGEVLTGTQATVWFTNRCLGVADFGTKGYWHNKNGLAELADESIEFANQLLPYQAPSSYFGAGDEPFDGFFTDGTPVEAANGINGELLAGSGTARAEVSHFLIDANSGGDPDEQLAQQLLAFTFNVLHRLGSPDAVLVVPGGDVVAADLIGQAVTAWGSGTAQEKGEVAGLLDGLNNADALPFVYAEPCSFDYTP